MVDIAAKYLTFHFKLKLKSVRQNVKTNIKLPFHLPINELQLRCFSYFVYKQMSMTSICARYGNERLHSSPGRGGSKAG